MPLLSVYGHGATVPSVELTMPQKLSFAAVEAQLAAVDVPLIRRFPSPHAPAVLPVVFLQVEPRRHRGLA